MKNWDEILSLYIDDMLDDEQKADVEAELAISANLRTKYENLLLVTQTLNTLPEADLPIGLHEKIMRSVKPRRKKPIAKHTKRFVGYGSAAAAALLVALYFVIGGNIGDLSSPEGNELSNFGVAWSGGTYDSDEAHDDAAMMTADQALPMPMATNRTGGDSDNFDTFAAAGGEAADFESQFAAATSVLAEILESEPLAEVVAESIAELVVGIEIDILSDFEASDTASRDDEHFVELNKVTIHVNDLQAALSLVGILPIEVLNVEHGEGYSLITVSSENIDFDQTFELLRVFIGEGAVDTHEFDVLHNSGEDFMILLRNVRNVE